MNEPMMKTRMQKDVLLAKNMYRITIDVDENYIPYIRNIRPFSELSEEENPLSDIAGKYEFSPFEGNMSCPFKIGDRIRSSQASEPPATVTELTERGFKYVYDYVWNMHPRLGLRHTGGECYTDVYPEFPRWCLESEWTPEFSELKTHYDTNSQKI